MTQVARSRHGSLFIGIIASLPIQQRDLLVRKRRISGSYLGTFPGLGIGDSLFFDFEHVDVQYGS
jgi:hypothetical protein